MKDNREFFTEGTTKAVALQKMGSNGRVSTAASAFYKPFWQVLPDAGLQAPTRPSNVDCSAVTDELVYKRGRVGVRKTVLRRTMRNFSGTENKRRLRSKKPAGNKLRKRLTNGVGSFVTIKGDLKKNRFLFSREYGRLTLKLGKFVLLNKIIRIRVASEGMVEKIKFMF